MQGTPLNYYQILESSRTATAEEIRASYKKLALQYHPDRVSNLSVSDQQVATEKMKLISNAYATLKDPEKRAQYDQQLLMNVNGFARQPNGSAPHHQFYTYRSHSTNQQVRRINPLLFLLVMVAILILVGYFLLWAAPLILVIIFINIILSIVRRL